MICDFFDSALVRVKRITVSCMVKGMGCLRSPFRALCIGFMMVLFQFFFTESTCLSCYLIVILVPPNFVDQLVTFEDFPRVLLFVTHPVDPLGDRLNVGSSLIIVVIGLLGLSLFFWNVSRVPLTSILKLVPSYGGLIVSNFV